ncbi:TetR/AcrR family transcriptional regulator [Chitinophaga solisilvae]|uniref:TetR/AcrR family transcriptional regulator n=1 Tax=Chitinophaga solisilvae TaxID=1233460 RepID=UPI00136A8B53|nr:TetR/AcrR family transcriptional regulator [Chitinophaga solisilvae]
MAAGTGKKEKRDASTEERILAAARTVFTKKGYAGTKVRDIAAEADINLSLVNYYFRSKEKLFQVIMQETVQQLIGDVSRIFDKEETSLEEKVGALADHYVNLLLKNPDFPLFLVNEILSGNDIFSSHAKKETLFQSHFFKQIGALKVNYNPVHIIMNTFGMLVLPFLARPILQNNGIVKPAEFKALMEERKKLIPVWIKGMIG